MGIGQSNIVIKHKLFNTCLWILHAIASPGKPMGKAENVKFQVCGECGSLDGSTLAPLTGEWHESYFRGWTPRVQSPQLNYLARISKAEAGQFFTRQHLLAQGNTPKHTEARAHNNIREDESRTKAVILSDDASFENISEYLSNRPAISISRPKCLHRCKHFGLDITLILKWIKVDVPPEPKEDIFRHFQS